MKIAILFIGIFLAGGFFLWGEEDRSWLGQTDRECERYSFIKYQEDCGDIEAKVNQVEGLRATVEKVVAEEKNQKHVTRVSVFFRDLDSLRWFGIDDLARFYPASLTKLPIVMAYYKIAEVDAGILNKKIALSEEDVTKERYQHYHPAEPLAADAYPVRELLRRMLVYSDNAPVAPLIDTITPLQHQIFRDLGVTLPSAENENEMVWNISARSYANLFRMLYNASYLRLSASDELLGILEQSAFEQGIVAGVPKDVKVAHKFGEAMVTDGQGESILKILNDCGIVYRPENPYVICIMTEGSDFARLEQVIRRISRATYESF